MKRRDFSLMLAAAAAGQLAYAQASFPTKPIRLIVPFAVGGGIDLLARMFAQALSEQLGQQMVVENQGGGGGSIAAATVARAPADGYTLLFQTSGSAVSAAAMQKLPFDPVKDFAPVTLAARFPLVLLVNPDVPAQNLAEFLQLLRREPGKYSYGSAGTGSGTHLAAEWFKKLGKVDMLHIPYKGTKFWLDQIALYTTVLKDTGIRLEGN